MTDLEIAESFFEMLKKHGVHVKEDFDSGKEFEIFESVTDKPTLNFCFHEDGSYWRIMGYIGDYFTDEIHKDGWK